MTTEQLNYLCGVALLLIGALGVAVGLGADWYRCERRGRTRRCPRCWYDMEAIPGLTCPECGRTAKSPRHLLRVRRDWLRAIPGAAMLCGGIGLFAWPTISGVDWSKRMPSFLLVKLVDDPALRGGVPPPGRSVTAMMDRSRQQMVDEVWRRYQHGALTLGQRREFVQKPFQQHRPLVSLRTRARWPEGVPMQLIMNDTGLLWAPHRLRLVPRFEGARPVVLDWPDPRGWASPWTSPPVWWETVGAPPAGTTEIVFDVSIEESSDVVWTGVARVSVAVSGSSDDVVSPASDEDLGIHLGDLIAKTLRLVDYRGEIGFALPDRASSPHTRFSLGIELVYKGEVVATGKISRDVTPIPRPRVVSDSMSWIQLDGDADAIRAALDHPDESLLRFTGNNDGALTDLDADHYWNGRVEIPLSRPFRPN